MSSATYVYSTTLTVVTCGECRIPFAIPVDLHRSRLADGGWFYCPNGHNVHYADSDNARLKREIKQAEDRATSARADADQAEASRRAWKGQATKLRNRAAAGAILVRDLITEAQYATLTQPFRDAGLGEWVS